METAHILIQLRNAGLTAVADSGMLLVRPIAAITHEIRALIRAHRDELVNELEYEACWCWNIAYPDGRSFDIFEVPEPTRAMVERAFPGAAVTPLLERSIHR